MSNLKNHPVELVDMSGHGFLTRLQEKIQEGYVIERGSARIFQVPYSVHLVKSDQMGKETGIDPQVVQDLKDDLATANMRIDDLVKKLAVAEKKTTASKTKPKPKTKPKKEAGDDSK